MPLKNLDVARSVLSDVFDGVRQDLAARVPAHKIEQKLADGAYGRTGQSIPPLTRCGHDGEHPPDYCQSCAPRWGFVGCYVRAR